MKTKAEPTYNEAWESGYAFAHSELKKCVDEYMEKGAEENSFYLLYTKLLQHLDKAGETKPMSVWLLDEKLKEEMIVFSKEYLERVGVVGGNEGGGQRVTFNTDWEIHFFEEFDVDGWVNEWHAYAYPTVVDEDGDRIPNEDNPFPLLSQRGPQLEE